MSGNRKQARGRPSKYPPEFRNDAVAMVLDEGRAIADVARAVGVNEGRWGTGPRRNASSAANAKGSPPMNAVSSPICGQRTPGCGWSVICSNDLWPSG